MNKLMVEKPILHAVIWIVIYIAAVNVGDALSGSTGVACLTGLLLLALSVVLILYLKKNRRIAFYGIKKITKKDAQRTLFYIPLILLAFIQFSAGLNRTISYTDIAASCLLMIGIGFVEELIFRGFLFQGIYRKSGVNQAILISGITFGIGHIVNLFRGYASVELTEQIVVAIAIGIVLALLVAVTQNIIVGILFHIVFNISGSITNTESDMQIYLLIAILIVSVLYAVYLLRFMPRKREPELPS